MSRAAILCDTMSAASSSAWGTWAPVASFSRRRPCGHVEAAGPSGRGGGDMRLRDAEVHVSRHPPPRRVSSVARARRQSDWELMDQELRGMRASSGAPTALGVDYGLNRTGLAVSSGGIAPRPLDVVPSKPIDALVRAILDTAVRERVDVIVVGLPVPPNLTLNQAAGLERVPRRRGPKTNPSTKNENETETKPAFVDVAVLIRKQFRHVEDLGEWLGFDGLGRELGKHGMKTGGTVEERSKRLWRLLECDGDLGKVHSRAFPKNAAGKVSAMQAVWANGEGIKAPPSGKEVTQNSSSPQSDDEKIKKRRPTQMHVFCVQLAERLADAVGERGSLPVFLVDETRTSLQASLAVESSRGGVPSSTKRGVQGMQSNQSNGQGVFKFLKRVGVHVDDVAAALLLERYFSGKHGPAIPVPPFGGGGRNESTSQ